MPNLEAEYRDLINKLALKRAVERALLFFIAVSIVGVLTLLFFQNNNLRAEVKNQQAQAAKTDGLILANQNTIKDQSTQIKNYVLCIGQFFASTNRTNETLDIKTCNINTNAFAPANTNSQLGSTSPSTNKTTAPPVGGSSANAPKSGNNGNDGNTPPTQCPAGQTGVPPNCKKSSLLQQLLGKVGL